MRLACAFALFLMPALVLAQESIDRSHPVHFPEGFRWCVATSAHQIEGGNTASDWWAWEHQPGHIQTGEVSGRADGGWEMVAQDLSLLKALGVTDYRLSVEWAKIEPTEGVYDQEAIAHYKKEIDQLKALGIRPFITLQHFTFPQWVRAKGAWEWKGFTPAFVKYTELVYTQIAPGVRDWVTINEPMVSVINGYFQGTVPPSQKRDIPELVPVFRGLLTAHAAAYRALHALALKAHAKVRVGLAHHLRAMSPANRFSVMDWFAASQADELWNWDLPNALDSGHLRMHVIGQVNVDQMVKGLEDTQDFFGINYYTGDRVRFSLRKGLLTETNPKLPKTDMGWDIEPEGLLRILRKVHTKYPHLPIMITENGIADHADRQRPQFLRDHLRAVAQAMADGVPIEGYCHWSLLDNFEWQNGFTPRFGLFDVDYKTLARHPRPSAKVYGDIIRTRTVPAN